MRVLLSGLLLMVGAAAGQDVKPMAKDAKPLFDVAAVKLAPVNEDRQGFSTDGSRVMLYRESVMNMILFAYAVSRKQVVGGPGWLEDEPYDVNGKPDVPGQPDFAQVRSMVRGLLVDRYGLKFHMEKREIGYLALRAGSGTTKLTKAADPGAAADQTGNGGSAGMTMRFTSNSMEDFMLELRTLVDRPVLDETGLAGKYDFTLKWTPDTLKQGEVNEYPGLTTAVQEQLGLRLESAKGPVEVMVVDAVARPSAN